MSPPPYSLIIYPFLISAGKVSTGKQAHQAYLSELLHASKNPHHTVNLLLQAPGPVLHPAIQERERDVRRACWSCSSNNQFLATQGDQDSYSLNSIFTREGTDTGTRMSL